jgi:hypothetical protein
MMVLQACSSGDATAPDSRVGAPSAPATAAPRQARITRLAPDTLTAGGTLVVEGEHLPAALADLRVTLGGVALPVRVASPTRLEATIPASAFPCGEVARQPLLLTLGTALVDTVVPLATATRLELAPGESASLLGPDGGRCVELAATATAARYVVAVVNTSTDVPSPAAFDLRGAGTGSLAGVRSTEQQTDTRGLRLSAAVGSASHQAVHPGATTAAHHTHVVRPGAAPVWPSRTGALQAVRTQPQPGDTIAMTALLNTCSTGRPVHARVVYVGTRALILEDIRAPRPGRLDESYARLGAEYDQLVHPLLVSQIGDPLAMNARMGGDGRVTMLFTPFVNDSAPGTAAYVSACNFYPRATFAGSNQDEVIYARVATAHETPDDWRRAIRSTIVHEAKHLASFAERLARGHEFEEPWLEEATARIAEELYARTFPGGGRFKGHTGFAGSVGCELRLCDDRPLIMWKHFSQLHTYLAGTDTLSPLGPAGRSDATHYASGWSLVRWILDAHVADEAHTLRTLVAGGFGRGLDALAAAAGRSREEIVLGWAVSNADGALGPSGRAEGERSWNTGDMWTGLATMLPGAFRAAPLAARQLSFGAFSLPAGQLAPLGVRYTVLEGQAGSGQRLSVAGERAGHDGVRVVLRRLE